tara:strand:- start:3209 stop:3385 length:177 start_codon:yes stop_codon:yes gene_type:complete
VLIEPFLIDLLKRKEQEEREEREQKRPRLELPLYRDPPEEDEAESDDESDRGVIIIDI